MRRRSIVLAAGIAVLVVLFALVSPSAFAQALGQNSGKLIAATPVSVDTAMADPALARAVADAESVIRRRPPMRNGRGSVSSVTITLPDGAIPPFEGVIQNAAPPVWGSTSRFVTLYTKTLSGYFIVIGTNAWGDPDYMGMFVYNNPPAGAVGYLPIQQGTIESVLPSLYHGIVSVDVFNFDGSSLWKVGALIEEDFSPEMGGPSFAVANESVNGNQLVFTLTGAVMDADTKVVIGTEFAVFKPADSGGGGTATLPPNVAPFIGPVAVTVMYKGMCGTVPYMHHVTLPAGPVL